jgi:hypothetical protein
MDKNEAIKILKEDIQDIYSIVNRFENTNKLHPLDIDLALSKVRNLYELFLKFNTQETYTPEYQKEEISTITKQEVPETKSEPIESVKQIETPPIESPKKEEPKKVVVEIKPEVKNTETTTEPDFIIETPQKKEVIKETKTQTGSEIMADKFQSKKFVHDTIAKNGSKNDVSSKLQSKPIKDITTAIGLNDKFIFIRELFKGDKDHYNETIQVLNNFDTYQNALQFLNENFDWDKEDENFIRLTELVRRKYM